MYKLNFLEISKFVFFARIFKYFLILYQMDGIYNLDYHKLFSPLWRYTDPKVKGFENLKILLSHSEGALPCLFLPLKIHLNDLLV